MSIIFLLLLLLSGCVQKSVHDTIESLPRGTYTLDRTSFGNVPAPVTPYLVQFLRSKGFLMDRLDVDKNPATRYRLYVRYFVEDGIAKMYLLADNLRSRQNDAVITITRTVDPNESEEKRIRLMITALDNKYPILSSSGVATCTFTYGDGVRPFWEKIKMHERAKRNQSK